jgi:hypothetical protein
MQPQHTDHDLQRLHTSSDFSRLKSTSSVHLLTPQMIATLEHAAESAVQRTTGLAVVIVITAVVLLILGLAWVRSCDPAFILTSAAFIALVVLIPGWRTAASLRADIEGGVYLTAYGPISYHMVDVEPGQDGGPIYFFRVDGEDFPIRSTTWYEIRDTAWGVVDYAPRSRVVFTLSDRAGRVVYAD